MKIEITGTHAQHGSNWVADLPVIPGTQTAEMLREIQGARAPFRAGELYVPCAIVVLADVSADCETWRVYRIEEPSK